MISIHAPARGATEFLKDNQWICTEFQSTLPRGERRGRRIRVCDQLHRFQSTLPRGERLNRLVSSFARLAFQSTLPRGERPGVVDWMISTFPISIHAPARGATVRAYPNGEIIGISIHAPARGATDHLRQLREMLPISIHAPARGATRAECCRLDHWLDISIHAPARGATCA